MINHRVALISSALLVLLGAAQAAYGQDCVYPSMGRVRPVVRSAIHDSDDGPRLTYLVRNRPNAEQVLRRFAIEVQTEPNAFPVQLAPSRWDSFGPIAKSRFYMWSSYEEPFGLTPGDSARFRLTVTKGYPAIQSFLGWGLVQPPSFPEGVEPEKCVGADVLKNNFRGTTIGPKSIRRPVVPGEFLNYLITLVQKSRQEQWIQTDQIERDLREKLHQSKRRLENGNSTAAQEMLDSLLDDVQALGCRNIDCDDKPLKSEAYGLLFYKRAAVGASTEGRIRLSRTR